MARITRVAYVACMARVALVACVVRLISFVWLVCGLSNFFCTLDHVWKLLTCNALPVHLLRQVRKSMFFCLYFFALFSYRFFIDFWSFFLRFFVDFETQIHRKTCTKIYTIWGALFQSKIVDDGEAQTLKILVLPRKDYGF